MLFPASGCGTIVIVTFFLISPFSCSFGKSINLREKENVSSNVKYVNPLLGTAGAVSIGGYGGTIPSTSTPFAMTHFTAMTQENYVSQCPYIYWQTTFYGFLASHQPAKWMGESGEIAVSFGTDKIKTAFAERGLHFNHSAEYSTASYYSIYLQNFDGNDIFAELSGVSRAGIMRFTFPTDSTPYTSIQVTRQGHQGQVTIDPIKREIYGWNPERQDSNLGPDKAASFKGYFVARFEEEFFTFGTALNSTLSYNSTEGIGELLSAFVQFAPGTRQVHLKMGVSYISIEQARRNLDLEIPDGKTLEDISEYTSQKWSEKLDVVNLFDATDDQKEMFYSAMFHSMQYPNEMFELTESGNAYYSGYDDTVHTGIAYTSYSIWDTFRAEWGFLNLFAPERVEDMIQSMLQVYQQSGRLPIWQNIVETNIMIGTHSSSLIAESLSKGFNHFNLSLAWEALYKDAMVPPDNDTTTTYADRQQGVGYEARAGLTKYKELGWVAAIQTSEAGSRTLEYAYDDYTVGVAAILTGHPEEADYFFQRSKNYRYLWNSETQFMCARNEDGSWNTDSSTWTEASNWVYTFNVQHDFAGLRDLFGNAEVMKEKLDDYFLDHHNLHPNEPSHATAYAYYYANAPDRAQEQLRHILRLNYHAGPFGLSGQDDCGQMSAWYVFNALGFYPVNPASGSYMIGSPIFDHVEIQFPRYPDHVLTIRAAGAKERVYVERLTRDGIDVVAPMITHEELMNTKELTFTMNHQAQSWFKDQI